MKVGSWRGPRCDNKSPNPSLLCGHPGCICLPIRRARALTRTSAQHAMYVVTRLTDGAVGIEFRVFVEATERQLFLLFKSIDRDNNGRLDKEELQTAFQRVGLAVPQRRLNTFFEDMDMNKDGFVSFAEWR